MKQRIKEIASQVLDELVPETWVALGYDKIKEIQFRTSELIVRECLEQIDKIRDGCEDDGEDQQALGADWAGLAVARHFGVEE